MPSTSVVATHLPSEVNQNLTNFTSDLFGLTPEPPQTGQTTSLVLAPHCLLILPFVQFSPATTYSGNSDLLVASQGSSPDIAALLRADLNGRYSKYSSDIFDKGKSIVLHNLLILSINELLSLVLI